MEENRKVAAGKGPRTGSRSARIIRWWAELCLGYRKSVLVVLAVVTAVAAAALPQARFDNAIEMWFIDGDPALLAHRRLIDTFGSDEIVVIGLEAPDVFDPSVLAVIDRVTRAVEDAPNVEKVFSLTNIEAITGKDGALDVAPLIELSAESVSDPDYIATIRERALANRLYVGNIVSAAGDFACIVARLPNRGDDFDYKIETIGAIREILSEESGTRFYLSGGSVIDDRVFSLSERDSQVTTGLMLALLVITLWLLLRSAAGVALSLATVCIATVWAMGWIVLSGSRITMISTMLPPLLLAVGIAGAMHVIVDYQGRCAGEDGRFAALRSVYREMSTPLFLTSLTTAVGMLSLMSSQVRGIREFGAYAAIGVAGAFVLSVTLVPIVLSYLPARLLKPASPRSEALSATALEGLHRLTMKHGGAICGVSAVLLVVGAFGATRLKTEADFLEYFKDSEAVKTETRRIEDAVSGTMTLEVIVDTGAADGVKEPAVLRRIAGLQAFLESHDDVSASQSIADYMTDMRRAFFDNDPREYRLPQSREEAAQYLLLYEMDAPDGDLGDFVTFDYSQARVTARVDIRTSKTASALTADAQAYIDRVFPAELKGTVTGTAPLHANMEEYIRGSLVRGFSLALLAIFAVFCLQMRSLGLGAIIMIPNVAPILLCLGIMGLSGICLDMMTAMVASITIGLAVDDSIHFVSRTRLHLEAGEDMATALGKTTVEIGRALVYTSVALAAGFGVMLFGSFLGTVYFGLLCALTAIFALAADLLLLPVVLRWYSHRHGRAAVLVTAPRERIHSPAACGNVSG